MGQQFKAMGQCFKAIGQQFKAMEQYFKEMGQHFKAMGQYYPLAQDCTVQVSYKQPEVYYITLIRFWPVIYYK